MPFDGVEIPDPRLAALGKVEVMLPGHWIKHTYRTSDGLRYCLKEALDLVGGFGLLEQPILKAAGEITGMEFCCIESFNDYPDTRLTTVQRVLTRTRQNLVASLEPPLPFEIITEVGDIAAPSATDMMSGLRQQLAAAAFFGLVFFSSFLRVVC